MTPPSPPPEARHPHPDWALAHVMQEWKRSVAPRLREAYAMEVGCDDQRRLCHEASERIAGFARALESVS